MKASKYVIPIKLLKETLSIQLNFNMKGVNTFLESSSIHGLPNIAKSHKYSRLFWILVVITGFMGAVLLIKKSFDSWSESPVRTSIETLPISEIKFPKVTVCPPKNTFTDLNYDLMMTENAILTEEMRDEMFSYAVAVINENSYSRTIWNKLHEEDRFHNWYYGYSKIESPSTDTEGVLNFWIHTSATSGVVTTQYYGEQFQPDLVERNLWYDISVYPPENVKSAENMTLHFKLEKVSMKGLAGDSYDTYMLGSDLSTIQTTAYSNFTPPTLVGNTLYRNVMFDQVKQQKLDVMPGFKLSWWYTGGNVTPVSQFKNEEMTKQLVR